MKTFLEVLKDIALALARIVMGIVLVAHGWHRLQFAGIPEQLEILEAAGVGAAATLVWLTIGFELVGGALLVFGLATPLIGLGIVVLNVSTIVLLKTTGSFYAYQGGWEFNAAQAALGLIFLAFGAGRTGVDHLFMRPRDDPDQQLIASSEEEYRLSSQDQ